MNPAEQTPGPERGRGWTKQLVVVILLLFAIEKVAEVVAMKVMGDRARQAFVQLDENIRETLKQTSPWFVYRDFVAAINQAPIQPPSESLATDLHSEGNLQRSASIEKPLPGLASQPEATAPISPLTGKPKSFGVMMAEQEAEKERQRRAGEQTASWQAKNPLTLALRAPAAIIQVAARAALRGPGHFLVVVGALFAAWLMVRPGEGWRWWLFILVPIVAAGIVAGLYFLCQGASQALGWALRSPSVPVLLGVCFGLIKIPLNMAIERSVHAKVARGAQLLRGDSAEKPELRAEDSPGREQS